MDDYWEDILSSDSNNLSADSDPSELSEDIHEDENHIDTWDADRTRRYHENISIKIKRLQKLLDYQHKYAPWTENGSAVSFWRKEHGWPRQIIFSSSNAEHYQCANALSVSSSEYGITDNVFTIFNHFIVKCGSWLPTTWWMDASEPEIENIGDTAQNEVDQEDTLEDRSSRERRLSMHPVRVSKRHYVDNTSFKLSPVRPYTRRLQMDLYPSIPKRLSYLEVEFHPLCFTHKYGFLAVGSDGGKVLVYCTMNSSEKPLLILSDSVESSMINSLQIFRWRIDNMLTDDDEEEKSHFPDYYYQLIISANGSGVIIYSLNPHSQCEHLSHTRSNRSSLRASAVSIDGFNGTLINDAKVSPNGKWIACVADAPCVFVIDVLESDPSSEAYLDITTRGTFSSAVKHKLPKSAGRLYNYTSQYLSWNSTSTLFAHTSDSDPFVLVWSMPRTECIYSIPAGGNSYAIAFHPLWDSVLAFTNRYGFFHTVDLRSGVDTHNLQHLEMNRPIVDIVNWTVEEGRGDIDRMVSQAIHTTAIASAQYARNQNISARHEITMVSFREEGSMRILAKLNGMGWSRNGTKLYIATKKRVLYYEFLMSSRQIKSLVSICGEIVRSNLEKHVSNYQSVNKGSLREDMEWNTDLLEEDETLNSWWKDWKYVPDELKRRVQGDAANLASHC